MLKEIIVKLKGEDAKHQKKFLCYEENVSVSVEDPILLKYITKAREEIKAPVEECEVIIKLVWG